MAKKKEAGYSRSIRNRGEEIGEPRIPDQGYDYQPLSQQSARGQERAIRRYESRYRYHDLYQLEQERDQRAFDRLKQMQNEFFAGIDPRRRQEVADGGMIKEDHQAMANLPEKAIHHEYPQAGYYSTPYIDSLLRHENMIRDDNDIF